jgi:hypothetical protein
MSLETGIEDHMKSSCLHLSVTAVVGYWQCLCSHIGMERLDALSIALFGPSAYIYCFIYRPSFNQSANSRTPIKEFGLLIS